MGLGWVCLWSAEDDVDEEDEEREEGRGREAPAVEMTAVMFCSWGFLASSCWAATGSEKEVDPLFEAPSVKGKGNDAENLCSSDVNCCRGSLTDDEDEDDPLPPPFVLFVLLVVVWGARE